mgnify:CR=1 FL=1
MTTSAAVTFAPPATKKSRRPDSAAWIIPGVVNGDVSQSQVVSGDHNSIAFNYGQASDLMKKVRDSIYCFLCLAGVIHQYCIAGSIA